MPVTIRNKLPDNHPFKGTRIIFGMRPPEPYEKSSPKDESKTKAGSPNPEDTQQQACLDGKSKRVLGKEDKQCQ